jgi:L-arabinose isomerase
MPYGFFRADAGRRACANARLELGGLHHQVMSVGHTAVDWRLFYKAAGIEFTAC